MHDPYQDPADRWDIHDDDDSATDRAYDARLDEKLGVI